MSYYITKFKCKNCGTFQEISFRKGVETTKVRCKYCKVYTEVTPEERGVIKIGDIKDTEILDD